MEDGLQGPRGVVLNRDLPPVRDAGEEELSADLVREMVKDALPEEVCEQVEWTRLRLTADAAYRKRRQIVYSYDMRPFVLTAGRGRGTVSIV